MTKDPVTVKEMLTVMKTRVTMRGRMLLMEMIMTVSVFV
jgi:hypothetical protein